MHLRCQHRDRHDHRVLDDHLAHQHLDRQSLELRLGEGYRIQHLLDVERLPGEGHRCEAHRPVLDELPEHHLGEGHRLGEGRGPFPGWS